MARRRRVLFLLQERLLPKIFVEERSLVDLLLRDDLTFVQVEDLFCSDFVSRYGGQGYERALLFDCLRADGPLAHL